MDKLKEKKNKGIKADSPNEIPLVGWKEILIRVKNQVLKDHVRVVAAGVAFFFFLSLFPLISVLISIMGLTLDLSEIENQISNILVALPSEGAELVRDIISDTLEKSDSTLGWSLIVSFVLSLWSASSGTRALFEGLNISYNEKDERNFFLRAGVTLLFTLGIIVSVIFCLFIIVGFPSWIQFIESDSLHEIAIWLRWPILAIFISLSLAILYMVAPHREYPEFKWVTWGGAISTLLLLAGSWAFAFYVENFADLTKTYGNLASVIILLLWFFISSFIILLGAEINSEMEHQTKRDTTTGEDEPMGDRGAYFADHVASDKDS